ncbi:MAG: hypothetical protein F4110_03220 [Acidimicrobiaceae bacterium]|nr:hypothetical protein [Acidimicrobiaceae bacterium]MXZ99012.1 hypothetical protein [Acidimicrobiaceae bacterium]MYE75389.1 hypothetical protein [Acidimicrobiaceae bacterium]MYE96223.1 hypothetical protein [Acidimicrobiaceae bacterium]MYH43596.1 hypothetical protein [Acidimicrobiaceae bacterium]
MNTFPYDSWEAALEAADGTTGYFTWGPGGNTASVVLAIIAIVVSVVAMLMITGREDKLLNEAADHLADKYNAEG